MSLSPDKCPVLYEILGRAFLEGESPTHSFLPSVTLEEHRKADGEVAFSWTEEQSANYSPGGQSGLLPVFINLYQGTVMPLRLLCITASLLQRQSCVVVMETVVHKA